MIDLIKVGSVLYPQLAPAAPLLTSAVRHYGTYLRAGIANGTIISDGRGGFVTTAWANDPRHQLNPDGTFKY